MWHARGVGLGDGSSALESAEGQIRRLHSAIRKCESGAYSLWNHCVDAAVVGAWLARVLGFGHAERRAVFRAGLVHDVGKVFVPSEILWAPRGLRPEEARVMREHPAAGAALITAPELAGIAAVVRHHHEAWDGTGYPDGLAAEAIPRLARLLSVADWYVALREDRHYKPGMSHGEALEVLGEYARLGQHEPAMSEALAGLPAGLFDALRARRGGVGAGPTASPCAAEVRAVPGPAFAEGP
jgi:HD-GYP domain-containing protein (c-di-GMP phosphodiesterase class II)